MSDELIVGLSVGVVVVMLTILVFNNYNNALNLEKRINELHK